MQKKLNRIEKLFYHLLGKRPDTGVCLICGHKRPTGQIKGLQKPFKDKMIRSLDAKNK